tara:strand:- start:1072 stop:1503 length:432 start_codon:yes stop_codon:yes gene_type:complete
MGAGIAKQIKANFPEAFIADRDSLKINAHLTGKRHNNLGTYSVGVHSNPDTGRALHIINAYTQFQYGTNKRQLNYEALYKVFEKIKEKLGNQNHKFGIPRIGCGLAGGNWKIVKSIITETMKNEDITLTTYRKKGKNNEMENC